MAGIPVADTAPQPSVSIVMATHNRRERLRSALGGLQDEHAAGSRFEVLLTVDGSEDGTREMLNRLDLAFPMRVNWQERAGPAAGRNRSLEEAGGDIVLFLDDDVVAVPGLVELHRAAHRSMRNAVVTGPMLAPPGLTLEPWLEWEAATLKKQYDAMVRGWFSPTPRQFYTANASVPRRLALAAGGFNSGFRRAEDVEFAYRLRGLGARFVYQPEAAVVHRPDRSYARWLAVAREYGRFEVLLDRAHDGGGLEFARYAWGTRRRMNRVLARWCLGSSALTSPVQALIGAAVRYRGPLRHTRLQVGLCSAAYNLAFWQGVAEESGLGRDLIRLLDRPRESVPAS